MSFMDDNMSASLDRWITGNYGDDLSELYCEDCVYWDRRCEREGGFCNKHAEYTGPEDFCADLERYDPRDSEPQDFDERRDRDE
jgi:hypothetical protein